PDLIAREAQQAATGPDQAERFLQGFAGRLGIAPSRVLPAYEDPAEWVLKEGNLPENVTPENSRLKDAEERNRIARVFARGLTTPAGFVLPIQSWQGQARDGRRWRSERWNFRRGHLYLIPGDSPVGFRLPLQSLPWISPAQFPYT
ncbi:IMP dehydrogenase, partial [Thioclava sp. BHET1]